MGYIFLHVYWELNYKKKKVLLKVWMAGIDQKTRSIVEPATNQGIVGGRWHYFIVEYMTKLGMHDHERGPRVNECLKLVLYILDFPENHA